MYRVRVFTLAIVSIWLFAGSALAHDGTYDIDIISWDEVVIDHNDEEPWKGWAEVTVENSMSEDWGDFHFGIYEPGTYNVIFTEDAGLFEMLDGGGGAYSGYSYEIDPYNYKQVDFEFYGNPVEPGETVTFKIYTDNTTSEHTWFGICLWPTEVPEPATIAMLGLGALLLLRRRK